MSGQPRHREHGLGDDRPAQQQAELQPGHRDQRQRRVGERVAADDDPLGHALGPRGPHVVEVDDLQHARPDDAQQQRRREGGQRDPGEDEGAQLSQPETGSTRSCTANSRISMIPVQENGHRGAQEDDERAV